MSPPLSSTSAGFTRPSTSATSATSATPQNPTDLALNVGSQIQAKLGARATVTVVGSTVTVTSPLGIKESDWDGTVINLPTTVAAPTITKSDITRKDDQGNEEALEYSSGAATGILNKNLRASATANQTEAVANGSSVYQFTFPSLSGIDAVTSVYGAGEDTTNRPKKIQSATLEMNNGVGTCSPCM